ncbi:MAG: hypothetical protein K8L91_29120 [Anaerolineae bacterium]|nr:hypothetical protein [Anaerolineae bacterium]
MLLNEYVDFVRGKLSKVGFHQIETSLPRTMLYHQIVRPNSKMQNEVFCFITALRGNLTPEAIEQYSQQAFEFAKQHKKISRISTRATAIIAYPLIITDTIPPDALNFVTKQYRPSHWHWWGSYYEFPVVMELSTQKLHFRKSTPIWGATYYVMIRKQVAQYFGIK